MCVPSLLSTNHVPASVGVWQEFAAGLGHRCGALAWLRSGSWPRRATKHSVLCVRWPSFSLGQGCTAASFGCPGARKRSGDRGPADAVKRRRARNREATAGLPGPTACCVALGSVARRLSTELPSGNSAGQSGLLRNGEAGPRLALRAPAGIAAGGSDLPTHTIKQLAANNATNNYNISQ